MIVCLRTFALLTIGKTVFICMQQLCLVPNIGQKSFKIKHLRLGPCSTLRSFFNNGREIVVTVTSYTNFNGTGRAFLKLDLTGLGNMMRIIVTNFTKEVLL